MCVLITGLVLAGTVQGYILSSIRMQFASCSMAANAIATEHMEQVLSAEWNTMAGVNQYSSSSLTNNATGTLCMPNMAGNPIPYTNYTSIAFMSNPSYAVINVKCVWTLPNFLTLTNRTFTNAVTTIHSPDL